MKLSYKEGTWFAIPLRQGGFGVGRIARLSPKGDIILAYLFGPRRETVPTLNEMDFLQPPDAVKVLQTGARGLKTESWRIIGDSPIWVREKWPSPPFMRKADIGRAAWRVIYPDDNPNGIPMEERIPYETSNLERDGLYGHVAAEIALSEILSDPSGAR
jgi:hypothetical protein